MNCTNCVFVVCVSYCAISVAGIMFGPYEETEDGFESQFAVNYLGHFLLTNLLMPAMKQASQNFQTPILEW